MANICFLSLWFGKSTKNSSSNLPLRISSGERAVVASRDVQNDREYSPWADMLNSSECYRSFIHFQHQYGDTMWIGSSTSFAARAIALLRFLLPKSSPFTLSSSSPSEAIWPSKLA